MSALRRYLASRLSIMCVSCALVVACSGAETQDVVSGAASSGGTSGTSPNTNTSSGSPPTTGDASPDTTSGGPSGSGDSGACAGESEPNDSPGTANTLAPKLCGNVSKDDPKDFVTFSLKPTTKHMSIHFGGSVRLRVAINGDYVATITLQNADPVNVVPNAVYTIEIEAVGPSNRSVDWTLELVER